MIRSLSLTHLILISFLIYLWVSNPVPLVSFEDINFDSHSKKIISVRGGASNFNKKKKPKNFNANFHRILQKGFPDWQRQIEYEQRQRELYESAQKKLRLLFFKRGTGFYGDCQSLEERYNVFDNFKNA